MVRDTDSFSSQAADGGCEGISAHEIFDLIFLTKTDMQMSWMEEEEEEEEVCQ